MRYWPVWASFSSLRPSPVAEKTERSRPPSSCLSPGAPEPGTQRQQKQMHRCQQTNKTNIAFSEPFRSSCSVLFFISPFMFLCLSLHLIVTIKRDNYLTYFAWILTQCVDRLSPNCRRRALRCLLPKPIRIGRIKNRGCHFPATNISSACLYVGIQSVLIRLKVLPRAWLSAEVSPL